MFVRVIGKLVVKLGLIGPFALVCLLSLSTTQVAKAKDTITVGVVPQYEPRVTFEIWQPILSSLESETGLKFNLKISSSIPEFERQFGRGEFDIAYMNPYHILVANRQQGYEPLVRDVGRKLYGILVVRKDSPIQRVEELSGKTIAFPAPNALGAALIPRAELSRKYGVEIKPKYVRNHGSVYLNVVLGVTDAGGGVQKTLMSQPAEIRDELRVIYETAKLAPHPIAVHPRVSQAVRQKVQQLFMQLGKTPEGQSLLSKIPIREVGLATMSDYSPLLEMGLDQYYIKESE